MKSLFTFKKIAFAAIAAAGLTFASSSADAGYGYGGYGYAPQYRLKKVVTYDYDYVTDYRYVTRYRHCGTPYQARIAFSRKVAIPVVSYVKVWY